MNREEFFYLLPYLFSLALSLGIFIYTWQHRYVRGARMYSWFVGGQTLTILGFIFELVSPNLQTKILWDKFQWLTDSFLVFIPFLIFAVQFSEHKLRRPRLTWGFWIGIPVVFTVLVLTNSIHHLVYPNPHLSSDYPFPDLQYDYTLAVYLYALLYIYAVNFYGIGLLIKRAVELYNLYRLQYWTMAIGFLIPLVLSFFSLANIRITPQRDISPFSFAIGNLVVAWGLFRYKIFDLVPIARERIFENMIDPVVVLDAKNRVVDMNPAALTTLGKQITEVVGHPSSEVFATWPIIVSELEYLDAQQREIAIAEDEYTYFHDLNISAIYNDRHQLLGRVIVARDITKHKTLEAGYRFLSQELEQRVLERTEELRKSAEQYRAVVENQTEFIVRWKADGMCTFANEAYCRYFGLTQEQAIGSNFLALVTDEDRHALEEKIARLRSGLVDAETDIHRVIKPDGSPAWQEWTDHAIRDESGQVVEFQSIGRDVTARKLAEDSLQKSEERFSKAFQASPTIITITQLNSGKLLEVNEAFEKIMGYPRGEALGKTTVELGIWKNQADRDNLIRAFNENQEIKNVELQFLTKSGNYITCYYSAESIELEGEKCLLSTIEDITQRKRTEDSLRSQLAFDELMTRLLSRFATCSYDEVNESIETALNEIAALMGAEYADLMILSEDKTLWSISHRWRAPQLSPVIEPSQNIPAGKLIWTENKLLMGEPVKINTMDDYPPEAEMDRYFGEAEGTQSLLSVPIMGSEQSTSGCIDLICYTRQITWLDEDTARLKMIGDAIANLLERKRIQSDLSKAYETTLEGWAKALELRDKETEGHSRRVTETTLIVARAMGFSEEELVHIRRGSILHDIGKMGISDDILRKNGPLTDVEKKIVQKHPDTAFNLLKDIAYLEKSLEVPYCHHEKWDGTGYPRGLRGEEIPLAARIFAVVDVWDALSSDRPYRNAWPREKIGHYLISESARHFDPNVVTLFLKMVEKGEI